MSSYNPAVGAPSVTTRPIKSPVILFPYIVLLVKQLRQINPQPQEIKAPESSPLLKTSQSTE